jgi:uncharacterized low-complexity protein
MPNRPILVLLSDPHNLLSPNKEQIMKKQSLVSLAIGSTFATLALAPAVQAVENPFAATLLSSGYQLAQADKQAEGKCGEGKCGANKQRAEKKQDGKCGEAKCGANKNAGKKQDGSCGSAKKADGSCGAAKQ